MSFSFSRGVVDCASTLNYTRPPHIEDGVTGWNVIGKGIVNGIQSKLDDKLIKDITELFFATGSDRPDVWTTVESVIKAQGGGIAFLVVGIVLAALGLIAGIGMCIYSCTCRSKSSRGGGGGCMAISGVVLALLSLALVITGAVTFGISTGGLISAFRELPDSIDTVVNNVDGLTTEMRSQMTCVVNKGLVGVESDIQAMPDMVLEEFQKESTLEKLLDLSVLITAIKAARDSVATTKTDVNKVPADTASDVLKMKVEHDLTELDTALTAFSTSVNNIKTNVEKIHSDINNNIKAQTQHVVDEAVKQVQSISANVESITDDVTHAMDTAIQQVREIVTQFKKIIGQVGGNSSVLGGVEAGILLLILIPSTVVVLGLACGLFGGFSLACKQKPVPSKGCCSFNCTMLGMCITSLCIAWILIIPASLVFLGGYSLEVACKPLFHDEYFQVLATLDEVLPATIIPSYSGGGNVTLKIHDVMTQCRDNKTVLQAIGGGQLINATDLLKAFPEDKLDSDVSTAINGIQVNALSKTALDTMETDLTNSKAELGKLEDAAKLLEDLKLPGTEAVKKDVDTLSTKLTDVFSKTENILKDAKEHLIDAIAMKNTLKASATAAVHNVYGNFTGEANGLVKNILEKTASCLAVYETYRDTGALACDQMGGPVQGMWSAAGLGGVMFLVAAIAFGLLYGASRPSSQTKESLDRTEDSPKDVNGSASLLYTDPGRRSFRGQGKGRPPPINAPAPNDHDVFAKPPISTYDGEATAALSAGPAVGGGVAVSHPSEEALNGEEVPYSTGYTTPAPTMLPRIESHEDYAFSEAPHADHMMGYRIPAPLPQDEWVDPLAAPRTGLYPRVTGGGRYYDGAEWNKAAPSTHSSGSRGLTRY